VDMAGMGGMTYPAGVLPVRVPCLGWVSLYQIFKALELGADGVLLVGCLLDYCQHLKGTTYADRVATFAGDILDEIGLKRDRLRTVNVCAAKPRDFIHAAEALINDVKRLGPVRKGSAAGEGTPHA